MAKTKLIKTLFGENEKLTTSKYCINCERKIQGTSKNKKAPIKKKAKMKKSRANFTA